jgi:hypothetical protein
MQMKTWNCYPNADFSPDLLRYRAFFEEMVDSFQIPAAERAKVLIRPPSQEQTICSPNSILKHQPDKKFTP